MWEANRPPASPSGEWSARLTQLRRLATQIAPDRDTAEEVTAEAAVRLVRWFGQIRDFLPWAATLVRRLTWSIVRRRRAQVLATPAQLARLPAREDTGIELRVFAEQLIARVPDRHAEILRLHREGLTHREIAERLSCALHEVGPRLARAQRAVRQVRETPENLSRTSSIKPPRRRSIGK